MSEPRRLEAIVATKGIRSWRCSECAWLEPADLDRLSRVGSVGITNLFATHKCADYPKRNTSTQLPTFSEEQIGRLENMSVEEKQARYSELAKRVVQIDVLSQEELSEMMVLRDSLQRIAAERRHSSR